MLINSHVWLAIIVVFLCFLQYAYGCIQDAEHQVCAVQARITKFREAPAPTHLVFILGVTNHWVTLLVTKSRRGEQCETSPALDSDNKSRQGEQCETSPALDSDNKSRRGEQCETSPALDSDNKSRRGEQCETSPALDSDNKSRRGEQCETSPALDSDNKSRRGEQCETSPALDSDNKSRRGEQCETSPALDSDNKSRRGEQCETSPVLDSDNTVDDRSASEKISLIYLDSNNAPVLTASDVDLLGLVHKKEKERVQRKGKGWSEWKRGVVYQAFVDQRALVGMLADCLCDSGDLRGELLRVSWSRMLDSYDQSVGARLSGSEDTGLYVALLLHWLEGQYHPQTIRDTHLGMLHRLGPDWLGQKVRERVELWVQHCRRMLEGYTTGLGLVDLFASVVNQTASLA